MPLGDIEIARQAPLRRNTDLARLRPDIADDHLVPCGHHKARRTLPSVDSLAGWPEGKLILVTVISPTPAGEGKTTTTVGVGDALNFTGHRAVIALREPSLGPVFGMQGGAAGGGYAQVVPMEDINLHCTGDFDAIALANFGADLGAKKFIDIKFRETGPRLALAAVVGVGVATVRAVKCHGGVDLPQLGSDNLPALERGLGNLQRHLHNLHEVFGLRCVVSINHCATDTAADSAVGISASAAVRAQIDKLQADGRGHLPVCVA